MSTGPMFHASQSVIRQIQALLDTGSLTGLSDRQLLVRFCQSSSTNRTAEAESAFATLVDRHGPMVLRICRQLLSDHHQADDTFQAVFLVLARRANSIQNPEQLANWLHGVTLRTARRARVLRARDLRNHHHAALVRTITNTLNHDPTEIDQNPFKALHAEIDRLPKNFRLPILLCYFQGLTLDQAATHLKLPQGTLRSRLARARDKLKHQLTRRGLNLASPDLGILLEANLKSAHVTTQLADTTARAATQFITTPATMGILSTSATTIAHKALNRMILSTATKLSILGLLTFTTVTTAAGYLAQSPATPKPTPRHQPSKPTAAPPAPTVTPAQTTPTTPPAQKTVTARVLDPAGKPLSSAKVDLFYTRPIPRSVWSPDQETVHLLGKGQTKADGRIHLEIPHLSPRTIDKFAAIASAPGFGIGWAKLSPVAESPTADIRLSSPQILTARLVDIRGLPAVGVQVAIIGLAPITTPPTDDSIGFWPTLASNLITWPQPPPSDAQGRLQIAGIGPNISVYIRVTDLRFAQQNLIINATEPGRLESKIPTLILEPTHLIEGRILAADTGLPIPNALVSATSRLPDRNVGTNAQSRADAAGRFKINPVIGDSYDLSAFPIPGDPYVIAHEEFAATKPAIKSQYNLILPRGVLIRGKVTLAGTAQSIPDAKIYYIPTKAEDHLISGWPSVVTSTSDGSFQITVPPGKGHLLIFGPDTNYVLEQIGSRQLEGHPSGGKRKYAHKIIPYEAKPHALPVTLSAELRPGVSIKARILKPSGQPVTQGIAYTSLNIKADTTSWALDSTLDFADGQLELFGLAPKIKSRVYIRDYDEDTAATIDLSAKEPNQEITIKLQPTGQAKARFVGPDGKPLADYEPEDFELVLTPGPHEYSRNPQDQAKLAADTELLFNVDPRHSNDPPRTDNTGHLTLPSLLPGVTYRFTDFSTLLDPINNIQIRKEFTVKPAQTLDLGDILIAKP